MTTLTYAAYNEMMARDRETWNAFNEWLKAESLMNEYIVELTFGEGHATALAYVWPGDLEPGQKAFTLSSPPPPGVYAYCALSHPVL